MPFTHLHVHTQYSLLDGSSRIEELISHAKELGMDSLAITDHGVMYGVVDFYKEAKKQGIRPIIGCEVYVAPESRFDKSKSDEKGYSHLILLCENNEGYQNLLKLVSKSFVEGFYYKPRVDKELLRKYSKGIIACSACLAGEVARNLSAGDYDRAKASALEYRDIFGENNYFLELQDHGIDVQKNVNAGLLRLSSETGIPLIASNDVHYTYKEDAEPHDILLCIQTGKKVSDTDRMKYEGGQYYLKSEDEMRNLFKYAGQALDNTQKIADRCNVELEFGNYKLPRFAVPDGYTAKEYLRKLCYEGFEKRYPNAGKELKDRLEYELNTIETMGFVDYFLIVSDFIAYAKNNNIPVGPGRGSAAGSVVAYSLAITNIDPIRYSLLFERFLNPERVSMPDIDVDFCYERRQEVIDYVNATYGKDNVAQIVTFGTLAARGVIRDVGRVLDMPYALCDQIAKMVPEGVGVTLDKALEQSPDLIKAYNENPEIKYLIDMSKRLEGLPRHTSMHAAGVLITSDSVDNFVPLSRNQDGTVVTQYTMVTLEELGLLKMDFLGLRTLTVIKNAVDQIKRIHGSIINIDNIDMNDKNVYQMLSRGDTLGVFQLESAGMTSFMKELKPESIDDIIAGLALYRPGPMDFIPRYIKGKENRDSVIYECEELEPILSSTYGCIVYQEQVMQIVQRLAGYTLGRADLVRRAMSKKKHSVMQKERENFVHGNETENVKGCIANGIDEAVADHIFDEMTDFASYAFNKSHAAAYAVVSYQTAWLKYYYPAEYMSSLLTSVMDSNVKTAEYIHGCKIHGIKLLPPDINYGSYGFSADDEHTIRYGLTAIKGVGKTVVDDIVSVREQSGLYTDLEDFINRMPDSVNKKALEGFIKAGAFDCFTGNRRQKLSFMYELIDSVHQTKKNDIAGQISLFDIDDKKEESDFRKKLPDLPEFSKEELLALEKESTGLYLSGHPLESYSEEIEKIVNTYSKDLLSTSETGESIYSEGQSVICCGIVIDRKTKPTKTGKLMAFLTVEDLYGPFEVLVFQSVYENSRIYTEPDSKIYISGHTSINRDGTATVIADKFVPFDNIKKKVWIAFDNKEDYDKKSELLSEILFENQGNCVVSVYLRSEKAVKELSRNYSINSREETIKVLNDNFGINNVKTTVIGL